MDDLDYDDFQLLKDDLLKMETFLNAQGLPWLGHQAKVAFRLLIRTDVHEAIMKDGDPA